MIYLLAVFVPPLALLLNGQPFSAILNLIMIVPCILFGLIFPVLFLVPSIHGVLAIAMKREDRKHREIVDAIEKHGPPPWWLRWLEARKISIAARRPSAWRFYSTPWTAESLA